MILPTSTYIQPVYIYQESTSYAQDCLEKPENVDIIQKTLKGEQLNGEEAQRVTTCIEESKKSTTWFVIGFITVISIVLVILITTVVRY